MKILIVNASDIEGGAARASYRLHEALLKQNIDSKMLVQSKGSDNFTVLASTSKIIKLIDKLRPTLDNLPVRFYKNKAKTLFSPSWLGFNSIVGRINSINPDIVHLHWVCGGMMSINDIAKINAPIVWSLHDDWVFTGGCHIKWDCDKYKQSCGACPRLGSHNENDLSRKIFLKKKRALSKKKNLVIIGLSKWLVECAKNSSLLKERQVLNLPNPINTDIFKPFNRGRSRELWSLPNDKKLVLFGAMNPINDINKGFNELCTALAKLKDKTIEVVVFGSSKPLEPPDYGLKTHYLGCLYDDVSLVTLYSAVDVMVVPSLQENLSNAIMESLSCGTPVVGFDTGGNSDLIEHKRTGYLARAFDSGDLARGIEWLIYNDSYSELCKNARNKVLNEFESVSVVKKYIHLYSSLVD